MKSVIIRLDRITPQMVKKEIGQLRKLLKPVAAEAYLFGSLAERTAIRFESDADVLIVPKKLLTLEAAYRRLDRPHRGFLNAGLAFHIIMFDPARHPADLLAAARRGLKLA